MNPIILLQNEYNEFQASLIIFWSISISLELLAIYLANSLNLLKTILYTSLAQSLMLSASPFFYLISSDYWMAAVVALSFVSGLAFFIAALRRAPKVECLTGMPPESSRSPTYGAMNILTVLMGSCLTIIFTQRLVADGTEGLLSVAEFTVALQIVSALSFLPQILNNEMVRRIYLSNKDTEKFKILIYSCIAAAIFVSFISIPFINFSKYIFNVYGVEVKNSNYLAILVIFTILFQALSLTVSTYLQINMNAFAIFLSTAFAFFCSIAFFFFEFRTSASHILISLVLFHCIRSAGLAAHLIHKSVKTFEFSSKER
ncbi:hypothetical protein [Porphyrobacter sp. HT-58-2]|uniref:hypothetical protein n=1 Tax=Porphyrobacter sp. HT-58-2 TaxID=2023229 RepID=UPI0011B0A9E9|nr:hypothetical protein [Porphyrobacter sp. HT-58-2]